jgi:hypothetical protein
MQGTMSSRESTNDFAPPRIRPCTISYGSTILVKELEITSGSARVVLTLRTALSAGMAVGHFPFPGHARIQKGHIPAPRSIQASHRSVAYRL